MARLYLASALVQISPPWLGRTVGGKVMRGLADELDALTDRLVEGVKARFPGLVTVETLPLIGRERRIRRGPGEDGTTYARRLRTWWDAHRTRGGPYALLGQLYAFFLDWLDVRMDVVYYSGTRRWQDAGGGGVVTRDAVTWDADGTDEWAKVWVFFYVPESIPRSSAYLITFGGDRIVQFDGGGILLVESIAPDELTAEEAEVFKAIPRDWSAAHIKLTTVVLLWGARRLWNYPQPVPTWSAWGASGALWGEPPVVLEIEG